MENDEEIVLEETTEDTTDWKAKHDEAMARLKRLEKKVEKEKIESKAEQIVKKQEQGLDRLDRIVLRQEGIKTAEELSLVESIKKETGKSVEEILESKYFKTELQNMREEVATKEATPDGTKRTNQSPRNEVDYWIAKGELPPADQRELRLKVVNAKMAALKNTNRFTDTPVIG